MKAEAPEQFIPKSALVAELKKRFDRRVNGLIAIDYGTFSDEDQSENEFNAALTRCAYNAVKNEVFELMCFLDTLEVKEVDLKKELSYEDYMSFFEKYPDLSDDWGFEEAWTFAQHFFELGLKAAQKGE